MKGAISLASSQRSLTCFNSRTREGCDVESTEKEIARFVSIHAPVKGAIIGESVPVLRK